MHTGPQRFGVGGPVPKDIWILLGVLFATYSLRALGVEVLDYLLLTPLVYGGFLWQLVTYPFVGVGAPSIWILLELFILFLFGKDVFYRLGRRNFWKLVLYATVGAAVAAVLVELLMLQFSGLSPAAFSLMQGQRMLITLLIAAFALLFGEATILFMFVLPIKARIFLYLEILIAFIAFLGNRDLAGFVGICVGIGMVWLLLDARSIGGILKSWGLRVRQKRYQWELDRLKNKRNLRVVRGEGKKGFDDDDDTGAGNSGPWVH